LNLSRLLLVLVARRKMILLALSVTVLTTGILTFCLPKTYKATSTIVLNYKGAEPVSGFILSAQLMPRYMATQVDIMTNSAIAAEVVDMLHLAEYPRFKRQFQQNKGRQEDIRASITESLLKNLSVVPSRESSVLDISYKDEDPKLSADVANAFAAAYQQAVVKLRIGPVQKAANYFREQVRHSLEKLQKAQNDFSSFQQKNNILNTEQGTDVDSVRYHELSTQLVAVQGELLAAAASSRQAEGDGAVQSPEVIANSSIQNLKADLARAEIKLNETAKRFEQLHPLYQSSQFEVQRLRSELARQSTTIGRSIKSNAGILARRAAQLQSEIDTLKSTILDRNQARDTLALLAKQVESAQRAYIVTSERSAQADLESQSSESDVSVLKVAASPRTPSSPNLMINLVAAVLLGLALGCGAALLAERHDYRVRSLFDLETQLRAPILAVIRSGRKAGRVSGPRLSLRLARSLE
jgi:succinoglycan biosynthesis transport protein ExoP